MSIVNSSEFARILEVDEKTVRNWIDAGMPAQRVKRKGSPVRIKTGEALRWWLDRELEQYRIAQPDDEIDRSEAERLLVLERKRKLELENAVAEGDLFPANEVIQVFSRLLVMIRRNTDAIGGRLCSELSSINDPSVIRERILAECRAACGQTADEMEAFLNGCMSSISDENGDAELPAESDPEPV